VKLLVASLAAFSLASAASTAAVDIYSAKEIQAMSQALAAKHTNFASQDLARYGNHYLMLAYREETGSSEVHQSEADIFIVESGTATIVTGGKLLNGHTTKTGEIRGSGIEGGERHSLAAGDIVHIPAGTPHQLLLDKSKPFSYFVVKVSGQ
jgi:mannose-6-phosphate isomerase-like protein (cupin superfamily)